MFRVCLLAMLLVGNLYSYQIDGGETFFSGGVGANINIVRYKSANESTPKGEMPVYASIDYVLEKNIGVFAAFVPSFSFDAVGFNFRAGAKYWFNFMEGPAFPYLSLAITPSFFMPTDGNQHKVNIGVSPGAGINYFLLANLMIGLHVYANPTWAVVDNKNKFELGMASFFDVSFRI